MIAPLRALAGAAFLALPVIGLLPCIGHAQSAAPGNVQFHEVQIAADAFSLGEPVPGWVIPTDIPEPAQTEPMLVRLADTQYHIDRAPIVYVRRAVTINDAASLSRAGQVSIPFVPQYHKLKVHAVRRASRRRDPRPHRIVEREVPAEGDRPRAGRLQRRGYRLDPGQRLCASATPSSTPTRSTGKTPCSATSSSPPSAGTRATRQRFAGSC